MADTVAPTTLRPTSTPAWSPGTNVTASPSPAPSPAATPTPIMTPAMTTTPTSAPLPPIPSPTPSASPTMPPSPSPSTPAPSSKPPSPAPTSSSAAPSPITTTSSNISARVVKPPVVDAINDPYPSNDGTANDTANDRGPDSNASASTPWIIAADVAGCLLVLFLLVQYRRDVLQQRNLATKGEATSPTYLPADSPFCYDDYKPSELEQAEPRFQSSELIFAINTGGYRDSSASHGSSHRSSGLPRDALSATNHRASNVHEVRRSEHEVRSTNSLLGAPSSWEMASSFTSSLSASSEPVDTPRFQEMLHAARGGLFKS
ncbi:hypothetical protein SPRG_17613 [Saprolegnia parasitica CBS 223.65]|uniref:Uncharacterized protein n=1 Tax=Saprolegnia parasitica (strain CBS 223.65) TaxID=695850 RepID=A0A067BEW7_SAPPC|nr:hypothetical protein SPRG_17613 [Saprolegnia parasitica CBS 223.65]KDO16929.1 hypothetical protein SPRG_17613 [Saprolegnia parasitica CBS 223.65]|eukprot:XP_012212363.1 hypothetical protein SPRG_17613 [Saprolegnia parasitica CBS 223.65]